ncbi:MAG TPA: sugar-binding protein [Acetobacteraceae bacterium]|jgi:ribose transport system substrate-binding protein|nr:sugar-binding protein [Acetobacteraceae bacterium]
MKTVFLPLAAGVFAAGLLMSPGQAQAQKKNLVLVTNAASDFWTFARRGIEKAQSEHPDYSMEMIVTGQATAAEQRRELDDLLARGVAGISVSVDDAPHATEELNKVASKAALVTTDSDAPQSNRIAYIGTDNVAAGRQAAEEIKKALPQGGKIMLFVGTLDADNARERVQGIRETLKGSNVEILDVLTDQVDFTKAKSNVEDTLTKYPGISLLSGLWSYNTPEIYNAVKAAGKCGTVKIVGFDEDAQTLRGISDGCVQSTVVQQPFEFGYLSMVNLVKYIGGDKSWIPADKKLIVPTRVIDKANVAEFTATVKKLLAK